MKNKGKNLFIISGPSGSGKDAVIYQMRKQNFKFAQIITITTRGQRQGESEGNPYHFVSKDEFLKLKKDGQLIEWAQVYGDYYGSTKEEVENKISCFPIVIHKIDYQGARLMKKLYPKATVIFIVPGSRNVLEGRVAQRKTDTAKSKELRRQIREKEYKNLDQWDKVVTNCEGELDKTAQQVRAIIKKKIAGRRKKTIAIASAALVFFGLVLIAAIFMPSLIRKRQLEKEFGGFISYLNVLPDDITYVLSGEITPMNNFFSTDLGKKGLIFLDGEENIALIIKNNGPEALSNTIRTYWAYRYPNQRVFSLPDGSYTYEYYPEPGKFEVKTGEYRGVTINSVVEDDLGIRISWADLSSLSVISPSISMVQSVILVSQGEKTSLDLRSLKSSNCSKISEKINNSTENLAWIGTKELDCWEKR